MDTAFEIDSIKIEKHKVMRRYRTFRNIANIVRTLEIFVAILFVSISFSWSSSHFPTMLTYYGVFLRRVSSILFSPHFVFVVGNVIVITLFVNASENSGECSPDNADVSVEELVFAPATAVAEEVEKVYRRSKSTTTSVEVEVAEEAERRVLRRSTTVPRRKAEERRRRRRCEEDELSDEEFNRKVEEFIEKQRRFLSEETKILALT